MPLGTANHSRLERVSTGIEYEDAHVLEAPPSEVKHPLRRRRRNCLQKALRIRQASDSQPSRPPADISLEGQHPSEVAGAGKLHPGGPHLTGLPATGSQVPPQARR